MNSKLKTAKEVEEFSELKRGIISITVESLCNSEYLTQITSEEDRRMKYLKLTEKAEPILKDCDEIISSYIEKLMEGISKEEMEICQRVFTSFCKYDISTYNQLKTLIKTNECKPWMIEYPKRANGSIDFVSSK